MGICKILARIPRVFTLGRNLGKLVENNSSKTTRRKQLAENNWSKILGGKLVEKQLAENAPVENSSQGLKIISDKYSANLVIVLCCQVLT